jgi:hypothetical protein
VLQAGFFLKTAGRCSARHILIEKRKFKREIEVSKMRKKTKSSTRGLLSR